EHAQRNKQLAGQKTCVGNVPHNEYQLELMFIKHLDYPMYDKAMVCTDVFSQYIYVDPTQVKTESEIAHGMIEPFATMGKPPQVVDTDGETGIRNSGLFQHYFNHRNITVHST
ncbi:MAG: hypothetical protein ACKO96_44005, partial [Flammeovirgaceae bacterium]